jgi:hypothetical protein
VSDKKRGPKSDRPRQLLAMLTARWASSAELQRLLAWRGRDGELLKRSAFAMALAVTAANLITAGVAEQKIERTGLRHPTRFLRRRQKQTTSKANGRQRAPAATATL